VSDGEDVAPGSPRRGAARDPQLASGSTPYRQVVETMSEGVLIADGEGWLIYANPALLDLCPLSREPLVRQRFEDLFSVSDRMRLRANLHAWLDAAGTARAYLSDHSGEGVAVMLKGYPMASGSFRGALVTLTDVSHETHLEARLRELLERQTMAVEVERQRIAADIHDDSIQMLAAISVRMERLRGSLSVERQLRLVADVEETLRLATNRLRILVFDLRPPELDVNGGLPYAIRQYLRTTSDETHLQFTVRGEAVPEMEPATQLILYRIAQEALINVSKHARALRVDVDVEQVDGGVRVRVRDDGIGFDPAHLGVVPGHLGMTAMRKRAEFAGGWWRCESVAGEGSLIEFWLPL
jgi:PAS domain S-box-containing protein